MSETPVTSVDDAFEEIIAAEFDAPASPAETAVENKKPVVLPFGVNILEKSVELSAEVDLEGLPQAATNTYTVNRCILPSGKRHVADTQKDDWR